LGVKINGREIQQGDEIPKGSKITFVVGDGYGNQRLDVPNVMGMAQDEADILLTGLGLSIGNVIFEPSDKPAGTVIKQQPSAGVDQKIKIGSPVNIWVSGDPSQNTVEN
jgi:beta-lactam-binding protein with PASTA domain